MRLTGKIALEEHMSTPQVNEVWDDAGEAARNGEAYMGWVQDRLLDVEQRLTEMDACGIAHVILSLTSPGIQSILDPDLAVQVARESNDRLHETFVLAHPDRFSLFAAVAMQDPARAASELRRAVTDLGARGAMINGYTNVGDARTGRYLDAPENAPFWATAAELDVPIYLHPREPLPDQRRLYAGYDSLIGSAWGFGHETATHAVRLMLSGLFDEHPGLQVILGHLGEGLPFTVPRLEHRLAKQRDGVGLGRARRPVSRYLSENFLLTTSGHFHTQALLAAIGEIGTDRLLFATDYPFETMQDAAGWFDDCLLSDNDKLKVARSNAIRIFGLPG